MRRRAAALGICAATLVAGCGGDVGRGFEIGLKRVAVDLAFSDETKAKPPVVITVEQAIVLPDPPAQPGFVVDVAPEVIKPKPVPVARPPKCPTAGPEVRPDFPVRVFAITPPDAGRFTTHNTGTFTIGVGPTSFTGNYPKVGSFVIENISNDATEDTVDGRTTRIFFDIVETALDGAILRTSYRTTNAPASLGGRVENAATVGPQPRGALELLKQTRTAAGQTTSFVPSPPVTIMAFRSGEGTSWTSAGIDQETGTAMAVEGTIDQREVVDVCGKLYDTYRVRSTERITNLNTGFTSVTDPNAPNIYNIAPNLGGLFIRREIRTTASSPAEGGATNQLVLNYSQTLDSVTPERLQ